MRVAALSLGLFLVGFLVAVPAAEPGASFPITFEDGTEKAGLKEPLAGIMGHGGAWGDFDGDGKPDLFVGGFCDRPNAEYKPAIAPVAAALFRNRGDGTFEHIKDTPATHFGRTSGAVFADLDNDDHPELYIANNAKGKVSKAAEPQASASTKRSMLLKNVGGKLVDISKDSGACPDAILTARNVIPFDYDADGKLDLLVIEDKFTAKPRTALFHNEGDLKFRDVTKEVGLPEDMFGLGATVADVNGDGRPDIFVPHANKLFLSTKEGKYREATELKDVFAWKPLNGEDWPCGAHFADLNRDGRLDLVLAIHHMKARNRVYINDGLKDGVPQFRDVTDAVGLSEVVPVRCPHVEVQDFDNDGLPDIYLSAALLQDGKATPLIFRNTGLKDGLPRFEPNFPVKNANAYFPAGPSADYDGDGRLDLFLINWFQGNHSRLMRNVSPEKKWLTVRVTGKTVNREGIGSRVEVFAAGAIGKPEKLLGVQEIATGYGYASGQMPIAHFGLNDAATVDVRVTLPGGKGAIDKPGVKANQVLVVKE
jgi:enediyne biosynthesis protein E4